VNLLNKKVNNFEILASVLFEEFLFLAVIPWIHISISLLRTNEYCSLLYGTMSHCEGEYKTVGAIWISERGGDRYCTAGQTALPFAGYSFQLDYGNKRI
jgi:hypothetical protein